MRNRKRKALSEIWPDFDAGRRVKPFKRRDENDFSDFYGPGGKPPKPKRTRCPKCGGATHRRKIRRTAFGVHRAYTCVECAHRWEQEDARSD